MNIQEYIASGILELYVYGILDETEMEAVQKVAVAHPEVSQEIDAIEKSVIYISSSVAPRLSGKNYEAIKRQIFGEEIQEAQPKVVKIQPQNQKTKRSWTSYIGWAASILFLAGAIYNFKEVEKRGLTIETLEKQKSNLQESIVDLELINTKQEQTLAILRDENNIIIPLGGQEVYPEAFAKIYWNQQTQEVFVDVAGLPEPPDGKVYQVWALKLNPLTPLSIGLLENYSNSENKLFNIEKVFEADAFGITLEPAGGSESPSLDQLYTLGKV